MEEKDKSWAVIQACKGSYLLNLMEGVKDYRWKNKLEIKRYKNATKNIQDCSAVEMAFPDNPDADIKFIKKLRTFTVNKTWIEMLFHFVDWHVIYTVFR